jgi:hypothetical protein
MNALILSAFLAGQCPGGVCPVPQSAVVYSAPQQFTYHSVIHATPPVYVAPRRTVFLPVRRLLLAAPVRSLVLRIRR